MHLIWFRCPRSEPIGSRQFSPTSFSQMTVLRYFERPSPNDALVFEYPPYCDVSQTVWMCSVTWKRNLSHKATSTIIWNRAPHLKGPFLFFPSLLFSFTQLKHLLKPQPCNYPNSTIFSEWNTVLHYFSFHEMENSRRKLADMWFPYDGIYSDEVQTRLIYYSMPRSEKWSSH